MSQPQSVKIPDPYQVLFPLGIILAIVGVLPWILFDFGMISYYPAFPHSRVMLQGFLMSFICGFLMTALPKMSGSRAASWFEIAATASLAFLQASFAISNLLLPAALFGCLQFLFLAYFLLSRIKEKTQNPPSSFIFIPFGLLFGFLGVLSFVFQAQMSPSFVNFGKTLLFQAFILNLIVGLGGRLIPVLSRIPGALDPTQKSTTSPWSYVWILFVLNFSFVAEFFIDKRLGTALRFLMLCYILVSHFKFFKKPSEKTWLRVCLRTAAAFMTFPYLLIAIWPSYELYLLHIVFISGFSLMTLMISVRVTLAHGGHNLMFEKTSKILPTLAILLILTMLTRSVAPLVAPELLLHFYACAAILWILTLSFWAFVFWPKILGKPTPDETC